MYYSAIFNRIKDKCDIAIVMYPPTNVILTKCIYVLK